MTEAAPTSGCQLFSLSPPLPLASPPLPHSPPLPLPFLFFCLFFSSAFSPFFHCPLFLCLLLFIHILALFPYLSSSCITFNDALLLQEKPTGDDQVPSNPNRRQQMQKTLHNMLSHVHTDRLSHPRRHRHYKTDTDTPHTHTRARAHGYTCRDTALALTSQYHHL